MENKCDKKSLSKEEIDLILINLMNRKIQITRYFENKLSKEENDMLAEIYKINNLTKKLVRWSN